jgi:hypothetical protein
MYYTILVWQIHSALSSQSLHFNKAMVIVARIYTKQGLKFSIYLKEKTMDFNYKDQLINMS